MIPRCSIEARTDTDPAKYLGRFVAAVIVIDSAVAQECCVILPPIQSGLASMPAVWLVECRRTLALTERWIVWLSSVNDASFRNRQYVTSSRRIYDSSDVC
jgi:hypothetical protein